MDPVNNSHRTSLHSYLPGVCLPLYPEDWLMNKKSSSFIRSAVIKDEVLEKQDLIRIPILPVVSIFLFPGSQLPMRIRQPTWANYISKAIHESRHGYHNTQGIQQVRIGIVTLIRNRGVTLHEVHGLVGKIGTFATVTYTHEPQQNLYRMNNNNNNSTLDSNERRVRGRRIEQVEEEEEEVIVTMIGTSRFRVISRTESNTDRQLPLYGVTEIQDDEGFTIPREIQYRPSYNVLMSHNAYSMLANISSISSIALKTIWPWKIIDTIVYELLENDAYKEFRNLPSTSGYIVEKDTVYPNYTKQRSNNTNPSAFSFWLASTLPMSDDDRIDLLENTCTIERLLMIRNKIIRSQDKVQYLRCSSCNAKIGRVMDIFTVNGADGANGAYVNPYGIIHQTWSVRQVCENSVFTVGEAEIEDSWFPGYSWTIAHCGHCLGHIGWQFIQVVQSQEEQGEEMNLSYNQCRPRTFWGISQANIQMFSI